MLSYYKEQKIIVESLHVQGSSGLNLDSPYQLSELDKRISSMEGFLVIMMHYNASNLRNLTVPYYMNTHLKNSEVTTIWQP